MKIIHRAADTLKPRVELLACTQPVRADQEPVHTGPSDKKADLMTRLSLPTIVGASS